jgi:four helix bundle protein
MPIRSFRDLQVWQRSMVLAERVYELTDRFPRNEQYGLSSQLKRAAVSIPSNIAEGHARQTGNYLNHLDIALGSEAELETQLELSCRLRLADKHTVDALIDEGSEIARMLNGLIASVERSQRNRERDS